VHPDNGYKGAPLEVVARRGVLPAWPFSG